MAENKNWDDIWKEFEGLNWFGRRLKKEQEKSLKKALEDMDLSKGARILDVGCGSGMTLHFFRKFGYKKSFGVDISRNSLEVCKKLFNLSIGRDIFPMDATQLRYGEKTFDLVFSDGLLEHFENPTRIIKEMCRVSKNHVLILQPNPSSPFGTLKRLLQRLGQSSWEKEYFFIKDDYVNFFSKFNFRLMKSKGINFNEHMLLLFQRLEK